MRNWGKKAKLIGLCMMVFSLAGCGKSDQVIKHTESTTESVWEESAEETSESKEIIEQKSIAYGDKITVSCTKMTQNFQWEYAGSQEFQVAITSTQFQNEFDDSEEAVMKQVEKAIGKTVGDTFTLWYEGGDGLYGYEYTIVDVKSQNPDKAEYGDKIFANYSMKHYGVDTCEGEEIHTDEHILHLLNTNTFFAVEENSYTTENGDGQLRKILGKGIGDEFRLEHDSWEKSIYYKYTIKGINKAVKYGDTIVTEVREANTYDAIRYEEFAEKELTLDLTAKSGYLTLDGEELSLEDSRTLCKELIGKNVDDRVIYVREDEDKREIYNIVIQRVEAAKVQDAEDGMEILMMAKEDEITKFYRYFDEYGDCYEDFRAAYSDPILQSIVINDRKERMVYEYYIYAYAGKIGYALSDSYVYVDEYDASGEVWVSEYDDWGAEVSYKKS